MMLHSEGFGTGAAGDAAPVVLLHGLFGRGRNLAAVARALAVSRRVIALDLRNHGASPHAARMDYPTMAADVLETLAVLEALPAALVGHSMGGKTAMACALAAPASVRRLVVADIAPVQYEHHNREIAAALLGLPLRAGMSRREADEQLAAAVFDAGIRSFLLQNLQLGDAPRWRIGLDAIAAGMTAIEGWPAVLQDERYDGPALFVSGSRSDYMNPGGCSAARRLFPQARFVTLQQAGHWLHVDQPQAFVSVVASFLADEEAEKDEEG